MIPCIIMCLTNLRILFIQPKTLKAQSTVDFPIGGHVNVLSDYKETVPENFFNTVTAVMSLMC